MGGLSQGTQLLAQIKDFVLTEEVNVRSLHSTVRKQVSLTCVVCQVSVCVRPSQTKL